LKEFVLNKPEFDAYANTFADVASQNTSFFDGDYNYFGRYRANIVKKFSGARAKKILDFGCGVGLGVSPLLESLVLARAREPKSEFFESSEIPASPQFDIITAVCVFHHIVPADRAGALRYCFERLKPGGRLFIFEHNPYNPVTRHLVSRCPVDRDAILLTPKETATRMQQAGFALTATEYCLFFPKMLAFLRPIETSLGWLPLGGQYYVAGVRP
jgi:SAM-dependent methyltransferase